MQDGTKDTQDSHDPRETTITVLAAWYTETNSAANSCLMQLRKGNTPGRIECREAAEELESVRSWANATSVPLSNKAAAIEDLTIAIEFLRIQCGRAEPVHIS